MTRQIDRSYAGSPLKTSLLSLAPSLLSLPFVESRIWEGTKTVCQRCVLLGVVGRML